ncbi:hypothetical protein AGDE_10576 [Angomonas deanei]|nr:hypothetical protein AGDE_10576 [Angomonas deanei]|eukprot:EPY28049.1 hypothetical protein AGDE_10576 [Angomonas deanei]
MSLWPFRTGNDDRFQTTPEESIYDPIKSQLPPHRYEIEVDNYLEWRSRRGFLQSVFPVACYGAIAGFVIGFRQSRVDGRYIGRYKVMWRYTSTMAMVGLFTSGIHHYMIVRNDYKDKFFYPVLSGTMGAVAVTLIGQMGNTGQGVFVGSFIGILYALGCYGMNYYHRRRLRIFLQQQQIQQVPVHKVSPELQRMYRAFLFDHRPLEDSDVARREAVILSRGPRRTIPG